MEPWLRLMRRDISDTSRDHKLERHFEDTDRAKHICLSKLLTNIRHKKFQYNPVKALIKAMTRHIKQSRSHPFRCLKRVTVFPVNLL